MIHVSDILSEIELIDDAAMAAALIADKLEECSTHTKEEYAAAIRVLGRFVSDRTASIAAALEPEGAADKAA